MKVSSATSARAKATPQPTGRLSDRPRPTPTSADGFALSGPSEHPDPNFNAYRKDIADIALAGRVLASHYAEPVERTIALAAMLREAPSADSPVIRDLAVREPFLLVDDSLGWAWGYAGEERRVGYVESSALATY